MKLYIKQKVFSWGDKFTVKDVNGEDRYFVEGEIFSCCSAFCPGTSSMWAMRK